MQCPVFMRGARKESGSFHSAFCAAGREKTPCLTARTCAEKNPMREESMGKVYEFEAQIYEADRKGGAYVVFPYDIREEFGRGRVKVHVTFDGK